jgi:V/A-type H+/Na+-transporting ATPase subunit I
VEDEAPTELENRGGAQHFQFMLRLLALPRYREIDPTKLLWIFFPLFLGLMVGDVVIGLFIVLFAWYLRSHRIFGIGGAGVSRPLMMGGILAIIFGALLFGEGLGMHFVLSDDAIAAGEHSWESAFGVTFPTEGFLRKVDPYAFETEVAMNPDALGTITLHAVDAEHQGGILTPHKAPHLNVNGWFNLGVYSKVHDVEALLVWSIIIGVVHIALGFMIGVRNVAIGHGVKLAIQEKLSWLLIMASVPVIYWGLSTGPAWALWGGVGLFVVSTILLYLGVQATLGYGFIALLEIPGLFGNILSYTRLAAIGASKAGMAIAFATIGFDLIGGVGGIILYLLASLLITALAILSGSLQALRLQFVEFFGKFYEGGGRPYVPFGRRAAQPPSTP